MAPALFTRQLPPGAAVSREKSTFNMEDGPRGRLSLVNTRKGRTKAGGGRQECRTGQRSLSDPSPGTDAHLQVAVSYTYAAARGRLRGIGGVDADHWSSREPVSLA